MSTLLQDLRYAVRMLAKSPGFTAVAVLTLALGLSVNIVVFSIVSVMFFKPLPVKSPEQLVLVLQKTPEWPMPHGNSWLEYQDFKLRVDAFTDMLALFFMPAHISAPGKHPDRTWIEAVSGNYFSMLGIEPAHGRLFLPGEGEKPGADPIIVLSHNYWQVKLGGDPSIVGETIHLNGHPFTVIGVTPVEFGSAQWGLAPGAFVPATMIEQFFDGSGNPLEERRWAAFKLMARLKPGVSIGQAGMEVEAVARQFAAEYPQIYKGMSTIVLGERRCRPEPSFSAFMPFVAGVFMAMMGLILFIACANVANLMYSRALSRQREMSIRSGIGATRWQMIRQVLAESVLLAVLAGFVGLMLARWAGGLLGALTPQGDLPVLMDPSWDWNVMVFTILASVVAGALTGIAPALRCTRPDVQSILKEGSGAIPASGRHLLRSGLVVSQVASCLVALVCGGLFLESLRRMAAIELGFRPENLMMASIDLGLQGYKEPRGRQFQRRLVEKIRALPGVRSAALASGVPFDFTTGIMVSRRVGAEGQVLPESQSGHDGYSAAASIAADENYFDAMGGALLRGRAFTAQDDESAPKVAIVNQTMARRLWPDQDAIGKRFRSDARGPYLQVVGVARDGKYRWLSEGPLAFFYVPLAQDYTPAVTLHVRTLSDPLALTPSIRGVLQSLDPDLPIYNVRSMREHLRQSAFALMPLRMATTLATVQGVVGLFLAVLGIYGVVAYAAGRRTREIGIRIALGARPSSVLIMTVRDGLKLTAIGMAIGLLAALALARLLAILLYGLNPMSPPVFTAAIVTMTTMALLASWLPARRAAKVDPMVALRCE
jgi:predicted permease